MKSQLLIKKENADETLFDEMIKKKEDKKLSAECERDSDNYERQLKEIASAIEKAQRKN
jgi:hypothetical protein